MIGQLLDGRYQILQILGGGSFSQTFLARDIKRPGHPHCVVKQLRYFSNNQVIKIKPENVFAYYNRALAYRELKNEPAAMADFQKVAKLCLEQGNSSCYKNPQNLLTHLKKPDVETLVLL